MRCLGNQLIDQVSFGGITIPQQGIGSAILDDGFDGVDGIIGYDPLLQITPYLFSSDYDVALAPQISQKVCRVVILWDFYRTNHFKGTTSDGNEVPTVTDNAFTAGLISARQVGVSFEPATSLSSTNGELSFGGPDTSKFTGSLHTV